MSVVCHGTLDGARVVVKAPLNPSDAAPEGTALRHFWPTRVVPAVLADASGVLLLSFVCGEPVDSADGPTIAAALLALHTGPQRSGGKFTSVPTWAQRRAALFDEYAQRLGERAPDFADVVGAALELLPALLAAPSVMLHSDVQGKNLLAGAGGVVVLDPIATSGPLGWEIAHSACSVAAAGGDPSPVLAAGVALGLTSPALGAWLRVGAVHHGGTSGNVSDPQVRVRLRAVLGCLRVSSAGS